MKAMPDFVPNFIDGRMVPALDGRSFEKLSPHSGRALALVARSGEADAARAVAAARVAQPAWAAQTVVARGNLMRDIALRMRDCRDEIAAIVAAETGKSVANALGEVDAAIEMGFFVAGEGRRYYGRTTTSSVANRTVMIERAPVGIAALIIASNTPIANVAWKAFPAMICGNASIMKPSEDTPATAWVFARICAEAGVPPGIFNVVQGFGAEAGMPLVENPAVKLISFTGSCGTGRTIQQTAGARLAKVCLELGGKNALVVCDDADLNHAVNWVLQSGFSNAGQRCAAASRIIVFEAVYEEFKARLLRAAGALSVGPADTDFMGPVINLRQLENMLAVVRRAVAGGATVLAGAGRLEGERHREGYYVAPTILENVMPDAEISQTELFGPITVLYRVSGFDEALALANNSRYGLTACIHTANVHRAMRFAKQVEAGVVVVNAGTHGSEPHMGFGGFKDSGTGWREAGTEALDVYSEWKYINIVIDPART